MSEGKSKVTGLQDFTVKTIPISRIKPAKYNPRRDFTEEELKAFEANLEKFGCVELLVWNERTGNLVGGHKRLDWLKKKGATKAWVAVVNLSEQDEKTLNLALNRWGEGLWDEEKLEVLLEELRLEDVDLTLAGFDLEIVDSDDGGEPPEPQIDRAVELQKKWKVKRGQVWEIPSLTVEGKAHRVMCGDSTKEEDVVKLMQGEKAQGMFTSPPYAEQRIGRYKGINKDTYIKWWGTIQKNIDCILKDSGSLFLNIRAHSEEGERMLYVYKLIIAMRQEWGWRFIDDLCWVKGSFPTGIGVRLKNAWEGIYHFSKSQPDKFFPLAIGTKEKKKVKEGKKKICPSGFNATTFSAVDGVARPNNVIMIPSGTNNITGHPAIYPVELPKFFLEIYSELSDIWCDPFVGSGTTIVAAEQTGRICYGMEIEPKYVAVTLQRLQDMGLKPPLS